MPGIELRIRLHLLDGGDPALPHLGVGSADAGRVLHPAKQVADLGWAAHTLPVLLDELEHGEVRLFGPKGFHLLGLEPASPLWHQHACLDLFHPGEPVCPHGRVCGTDARYVGAVTPEITKVPWYRSFIPVRAEKRNHGAICLFGFQSSHEAFLYFRSCSTERCTSLRPAFL